MPSLSGSNGSGYDLQGCLDAGAGDTDPDAIEAGCQHADPGGVGFLGVIKKNERLRTSNLMCGCLGDPDDGLRWMVGSDIANTGVANCRCGYGTEAREMRIGDSRCLDAVDFGAIEPSSGSIRGETGIESTYLGW